MSEAKEIARDGATPVKNSGRGWVNKGDARLYPFTIDYKEYTEAFSVSRSNWSKLQSDAFRNEQDLPAFRLVLGEEGGTDKLRVWVIGDEIFKEMREAWLEKYGEQ